MQFSAAFAKNCSLLFLAAFFGKACAAACLFLIAVITLSQVAYSMGCGLCLSVSRTPTFLAMFLRPNSANPYKYLPPEHAPSVPRQASRLPAAQGSAHGGQQD